MEGKRCALLIGNNAYCDAEFPPLTKPARDVADFAELLRNPQIGAFDDVIECVDRSWHEARLDLSRFFRQRHKDDLLLLYFSGHGRRESGEFYLVFSDTAFDDLDATAINAQFVRKHIDLSPSQRKIILLDCCYSGAFGEKGAAAGAADALNAFEGNGYGRIILTASKATETAQELPKGLATPYSLFTHFLLEGIRTGNADKDDDGDIAADELFEYVSDQMRAIAAPQTPQRFVAAQHGEIVIAKNPCWTPPRQTLSNEVEALLKSDLPALRLNAITLMDAFRVNAEPALLKMIRQRLEHISVSDKSSPVKWAARGVLEAISEQSKQTIPNHDEIIELRDDKYELLEEPDEPSVGDTWREPITGMEFVYIPAGQFMMGQTEAERSLLSEKFKKDDYQKWFARELPRHQVIITHGFWMGKYPVIQSEWQSIMGNNPSMFKGERRPMEGVSWNDAQEFLKKLNAMRPPVETHGRASIQYRLPSEAEWEYACRAGTTTPFSFGETISIEQANYNGNYIYDNGKEGVYREQTTNVGSFPPNTFGLCDMHGNIWEWCQDSYASYNETPKDGNAHGNLGDGMAKVLRGGAWSYHPYYVRSAVRFGVEPDSRYSVIGFRVAAVR